MYIKKSLNPSIADCKNLMFVNSNILDLMNHQIYNITLYISTLSWLFQIFLGLPVCSHNNFVPSFLSRFYHKQKRHSLFSGAQENDKQHLKVTLLANLFRFRQFFTALYSKKRSAPVKPLIKNQQWIRLWHGVAKHLD